VREEGFSAVADIDLRVSRDSSSTVPNVHSHAARRIYGARQVEQRQPTLPPHFSCLPDGSPGSSRRAGCEQSSRSGGKRRPGRHRY
jgi:hypothetical protein